MRVAWLNPLFYDHETISRFSAKTIDSKAAKIYEMFSSSSYDRRGDRGRGRGRSGYSVIRRGSGQGWRSAGPETPRSPSPPTGPVLVTIRYSELEADQASTSDSKITGLEDVASYNWLKANQPTIMTPGKYSHKLRSHNIKRP